MDDAFQVVLKNNPFVPPKGTCCPVNQIPPELLSLIFEVGARSFEDEGDSDEEDEAMATFWNLEEEAEDDGDEDGVSRQPKRSSITREVDVDENSSSDSESSTASDTTYELSFELLISHVCQHWRTVAINTPSLWTTIIVSPFESAPYERVVALLERSKSLPIDIQIDCEPPDDDDDSDDSSDAQELDLDKPPHSMPLSDLDALMSLLIPHIPRWGSIEVAVATYKHMFVFLSAVSDSSIAGAPQLEALQLYHHEDLDRNDVPEIMAHPDFVQRFKLFGGVAPRLKNVVLSGVHVDWCQGWLSCGSNLLDLELAYHAEDVRPSWTQFVGILRSASRLERFSLCASGPLGAPQDWILEGSFGGYGDHGYVRVIELPSLTELVLAFHSPVYVSGLLRHLAFPSLKSLTLDLDDGDYTDIVTQLAGPSTAVPVVLKDGEKRHSLLNGLATLKIAGLPCSDRSVELMYAELGNLQTLKLSMAHLSPVFLQLLYRTCSASGCQVWLPSLTTLSTADVPGNQVRELVLKRKDAGVPLKAVYMEENDEVTEYDVQWFKENLETFDLFSDSDDEFEPLANFEEEHESSESEWEEIE